MGYTPHLQVRLDLGTGHAARKAHGDNLTAHEHQYGRHVDPFATSSLVDSFNPVTLVKLQLIDLVCDIESRVRCDRDDHNASQARQAAPSIPARSPRAARSIRGVSCQVIRPVTSVRSGAK